MKTIKIKFVDFFKEYNPKKNLFVKLLAQKYKIEYSDDPNLLFCSCYGTDYLKYNCSKVYFTPENIRPDFSAYDYAISFDYSENNRNYRWPLHAFYVDFWSAQDRLLQTLTEDEAVQLWRSRSKFCCMVVSNPHSAKRLDYFKRLNEVKTVDSGGKVYNNVGGPVKDKQQFISNYRFAFAFENSSYPGYTTEKIIEPLMMGNIPLYWGNPVVGLDFNKERFIHAGDFKNADDFIKKVIMVDADEALAIDILTKPVFANNQLPDALSHERLADFLYRIVDELGSFLPVANRKSAKYIHYMKRKHQVVKSYTNIILKRNFR